MTTSRIAGLWERPGCGRRWGSGHDEAMIRWLRPRGGVGEPPVQVMAQTLARHFDAAHVDGSTVRLGFADLTVRCQVGPVGRLGSFFAVPLYFWLSGGPLGSKPIFASISGYEQSPRNAVIAGTCNWACSFGPVLYSGLAGAPVTDPDTDEFEAVLEGRRYRVVLAKVDRAMSYTSDNDTVSRFRAARSRHGGRHGRRERQVSPGNSRDAGGPDRGDTTHQYHCDPRDTSACEVVGRRSGHVRGNLEVVVKRG